MRRSTSSSTVATTPRRTTINDVVICEPLRTPVGKYGGVLGSLGPAELGVPVLRALVERTGIDPATIGDVILGHCNSTSEGPSLGRIVALDAGLPITVPGYHLDRRCGSGLQAILNGAMMVGSGTATAVVAGGIESMSTASFYSLDMRWGAVRTGVRMHDSLTRARVTAGGQAYPVPGGMIETAENLRAEYNITRTAQDELALESHRRAVAAQEAGVFAEEIVPVEVTQRGGTELVELDEHPRRDLSIEDLEKLKPLMISADPEATVTAGNASGQNDAAALCLVTSRDHAEQQGLRPLVRLVTWAVSGVAPRTMGIGPVPASALALDRAGLTLADMDLIELNEAFAAQTLAVLQEWKFTVADLERTNVNGSGISLGHPVGATGGRLVGTLARELVRRQGRYGLVTICIGGGQGLVAVFERVAD